MRILVTGGGGFIGSHLTRELREHGHKVIPVDKDWADLAKPGLTTEAIRAANPEYVVHLAARYGRILCADRPHQSVADNAAATTELAAACAERGIPVLYSSSSEVYGDHGTDTITEDSELRMPTTIYGLSKRWGEEALRLYLDNPTIVRLNMLYGPEQRAGYGCCALATFIDSALKGEPFTVHRGTSRSWLYISDAVRALRLLIEGEHAGTYNLGNDLDRRTTFNVAACVCNSVGASPDLIAETWPPANQIADKNYDCSKLRATIDWQPEVPLAEGIARTVKWQREHGAQDYSLAA